MFDDEDAQLQNGAHANKLLAPTSISVAFSSRLSTIFISKEKAEVVSEPMGAFVGIFLGRYLEIYHGSIRLASQLSFFCIGKGTHGKRPNFFNLNAFLSVYLFGVKKL
jgi:hypothetical protein